jgi:hypothetical protein
MARSESLGLPAMRFRDSGDNLLLVGGFTNYYRVTDIHTLFSNNENSVAVIVVIPIAFRMPSMLVFIPPSMTHIPQHALVYSKDADHQQ